MKRKKSLKNVGTHVRLLRLARNREIIIPVISTERSFTPHSMGILTLSTSSIAGDLTYRETSSPSLPLSPPLSECSFFKRPMRYKCRSIFTKRGAIYHPRVQLAWPGSLSFFLVFLLFALVVSRAIAFPDVGPTVGTENHPRMLVSIHLRRNTAR